MVDVTDDDQVRAWAERLIDEQGAPELLINNAASINRNAPLWEVSAADFDQIIDVNLKGIANVIRHFVPAMVARKQGVIVNLSSYWGRSTAPEVAPYLRHQMGRRGFDPGTRARTTSRNGGHSDEPGYHRYRDAP